MNRKLAEYPGTCFDENPELSREQLVAHLNEDLAREYQAIIA